MIEIRQATEILSQEYGLEASLTRLAGDQDFNFRAVLENGQCYVFKIMHPECSEKRVRLQCAALTHLADAPLNLPAVVASRKENNLEIVNLKGMDHIVWLLSWCPGTLLAEYSPLDDILFASFGTVLAQLDNALQDFHHPDATHDSPWNLTRAMEVSDLAADIQDETREMVRGIFKHFSETTLGLLSSLPQGVIHNDANDYNVLVNVRDGKAVVDGLFDFGDLSRQPVICDVAIALAYLIMDKQNPLAVCAAFLRGYTTQRELCVEELQPLLDLIRTRLAVSIAISSHRQLQEPSDHYITISQQPAKDALKLLQSVTSDEAKSCFQQACGWSPGGG